MAHLNGLRFHLARKLSRRLSATKTVGEKVAGIVVARIGLLFAIGIRSSTCGVSNQKGESEDLYGILAQMTKLVFRRLV